MPVIEIEIDVEPDDPEALANMLRHAVLEYSDQYDDFVEPVMITVSDTQYDQL